MVAVKKELRLKLRERRLTLAAEKPEAALALCAQFGRFFTTMKPALVGTYIAQKGEIDPQPLEKALAAQGCLFALPCVVGKGQPLVFRAYDPGDVLRLGALAIPEPLAAARTVEPDLFLVPLIAFDRHGGRLGQGGGYYDRTLTAHRAKRKITAIGLAFAGQEIEEVPQLPTDQRLDYIVTENEVIPIG